ncbi:MAG: L-aspartate oxidase [Opitutales bacterium]|jgi:L-aspartate oxidase
MSEPTRALGVGDTYDVIVVGSGIAGLSFALKVAAKGWRVLILTKKDRAESNTNYAQGGIAAVTSQTDDFNSHVRDTLEAGDGLCDEAVVRAIVEEAPARIHELAEMGVRFTTLEDGRISLGKEGGHSKRRILHVKDVTGRAIEQALLHGVATSPQITTLEHFFAIDLITAEKLRGGRAGEGDNRVLGLYALDVQSRRVLTFRAPVVMLATGGAGQVYQYTTNPDIATGDGVAMAYRAGVEVANLEFIQFHPTALYTRDSERFLISEAVRGEGAVLRNAAGEAFMKRYHPRADLAPRDVVARAIDSEMKRLGSRHVWLDMAGLAPGVARERFPNICEVCARHGIDVEREPVPVVPAAHYLCGGVRTNLRAETGLAGLYACGEVGSTGLHGANRLASNSLLEAVVLAHHGAAAVDGYLATGPRLEAPAPDWVDGDAQDPDERVVLAHNSVELKQTMWDYVGIVRTTKRLQRARARIAVLAHEIEEYYWNFKVEPALLELRNLALVAELIVACALQRKESRGLHYILDYPGKLPEARDTVMRKL